MKFIARNACSLAELRRSGLQERAKPAGQVLLGVNLRDHGWRLSSDCAAVVSRAPGRTLPSQMMMIAILQTTGTVPCDKLREAIPATDRLVDPDSVLG